MQAHAPGKTNNTISSQPKENANFSFTIYTYLEKSERNNKTHEKIPRKDKRHANLRPKENPLQKPLLRQHRRHQRPGSCRHPKPKPQSSIQNPGNLRKLKNQLRIPSPRHQRTRPQKSRQLRQRKKHHHAQIQRSPPPNRLHPRRLLPHRHEKAIPNHHRHHRPHLPNHPIQRRQNRLPGRTHPTRPKKSPKLHPKRHHLTPHSISIALTKHPIKTISHYSKKTHPHPYAPKDRDRSETRPGLFQYPSVRLFTHTLSDIGGPASKKSKQAKPVKPTPASPTRADSVYVNRPNTGYGKARAWFRIGPVHPS